MVDLSPLNLAISHWNHSLRKALQIHLPICSACYYACKGEIMFFATALERKCPPDTLSHFKPKPGPEIALDIAINHAHLSPVQKEALQLAFGCMLCLISSSLADPMTSRKSHTQYIPTDNTLNHSLLEMDSCSMEKSSSSIHQKGRWSLVLFTNHTKA